MAADVGIERQQLAPVETGHALVIAIDERNNALVGRHTSWLRADDTVETYRHSHAPTEPDEFLAFLARTVREGFENRDRSVVIGVHGEIKDDYGGGASTPQQLSQSPHVPGVDHISPRLGVREHGLDVGYALFRLVPYEDLVAHAAAARFGANQSTVVAIDLGRTEIHGGSVQLANRSFRATKLSRTLQTMLSGEEANQDEASESPSEQNRPQEVDAEKLALVSAKLGTMTSAGVLVLSWDVTGSGLTLDERDYFAALRKIRESDSLAPFIPEIRLVHKQGELDPHLLHAGHNVLLDSLLTRSLRYSSSQT